MDRERKEKERKKREKREERREKREERRERERENNDVNSGHYVVYLPTHKLREGTTPTLVPIIINNKPVSQLGLSLNAKL